MEMDTVSNTTFLNSFKAAPQVRGRPVWARRAVQALFFLNGALIASWAARVPALQAQQHLGNGMLGVALFCIGLGALVAMPLAGALTGRIGSDTLCRVSGVVYALMLPLVALVPSLPLFIGALFCLGASHAALDVGMNAQAVAIEKRYQAPIMSSFHALWSTGCLAGAAIGGLLAAHQIKPGAHFLSMALIFGIGLASLSPKLVSAPEERVRGHAPRSGRPRVAVLCPKLLVLGIIAFCVMVGEGAMADWSAVYLRNNLHSTEGMAAAGYAAFSVAMAAGRFMGDRVAGRFRPRTIVRNSTLLAGLGVAVAVLSRQTPAALLGFALVGAGFSIVVPTLFSSAGNVQGVAPGVALGAVSSLGYIGFLIGPPVIGFLAQQLGLQLALGVLVLTSALAAVLAGRIPAGGNGPAPERSSRDATRERGAIPHATCIDAPELFRI